MAGFADPHRVLAELSRVLNDRGRLIVMEHGRADEPGVSRWQDAPRTHGWFTVGVASKAH